jgi:hypothetical protein
VYNAGLEAELRAIKKQGKLKPGEKFTLTVRGERSEEEHSVDVNYENFVNDISVGDTVLVDNGEIHMKVLAKHANKVECEVLTAGRLGSRRHINLPGVKVNGLTTAQKAQVLAIVRQDRVATFLLKKTPFTAGEIAQLQAVAGRLGFDVLYAPGSTVAAGDARPQFSRPAGEVIVDGASTGDYARLVLAPDRERFYAAYRSDIRPTTDDRPFFFHTTKIEDQFDVAFGQKMLFGNGLSALMTLLGISAALVVMFVIGPLILAGRGQDRPSGWLAWLVYFGALGAGFMLIEVSVLQRFVLLLGHPVYSLTVTLFSLLLGTGLGAAWSRGFDAASLRRTGAIGILVVAAVAIVFMAAATPIVNWAIPFSRGARMLVAAAMLAAIGVALGIPMPTGMRMLTARAPHMLAWAWGMNGALSVLGATLAIFIAMNWGFRITLLTAMVTYLIGLAALLSATQAKHNQ